MYLNTTYQRQGPINNKGLLPSRNLKQMVGSLLLLMVFLAGICVASADGLFDFQMKLAQKGNAEAQFKIGEMYETGFGTTKDMKLAKEWISKAAAQGNERAKFKLLYWDMKKNGLTKGNKAEFKNLNDKANSEDPGAEFYLGKIYAEGAGVRVNRTKALDLYNKATLKGSIEAERAATQLRDQINREDQARKAAELKRQAALKAKHEEELRQQKAARLAAQKKAAAERAAKQSAAKPKPVVKTPDNKAQQEQQAKSAAQRSAEQKALEAKRQALLKQRQEEEAKRKAEFDSDPCKGKSARFLSTCH
jgi:hypothetical protein